MACAIPSNICATCLTLSAEQKQKPGILLCIGCQKHFCFSHIAEHRQNFTNLLDNEVANERNALQGKVSKLYEQHWSANINLQIEKINKWELETIDLIKQSAEYARKQIQELTLKECDKLQKQLAILSDEIIILRDNENHFENDIEQLINRLKQLENDIEHFPIEVNINEIPQEFIIVKSNAQPEPLSSPSLYFIDHLLKSQKPKASYNVSITANGEMCPIGDELVAFYCKQGLPTLNINNGSWQSLGPVPRANESHWSDSLQLFLILHYSERNNQPNKIYQCPSNHGSLTEIFVKPSNWNCGSKNNFTTLTCFKQHVLIIVDGNKIEKWLANNREWHTDKQELTCWYSPISCQELDKIQCIRMNDLYYALIIKKYNEPNRYHLELRSHGMSILHCINTDYNHSPGKMRLLSLPNESGWLFFYHGQNKYYCYVIDNNAKRYDQNIVLTSNVTDILVKNNFILLRKNDKDFNQDLLEIYDWLN